MDTSGLHQWQHLGSHVSLRNLALPCGTTYYLTVRATNCAGLSRTVASKGIKLCCSPPSAGTVAVTNAAGETVEYASNASTLTVRWSGFS